MASFVNVKEITAAAEVAPLVAAGKVVLFFWAEWHEPSRVGGQMHNVVRALASKYPSVTFAVIEAEGVPDVSQEYEVKVVPTFVCVENGTIFNKYEGTNPPEISAMVKAFSEAATPQNATPGLSPALKNKLTSLINTAPVMLFMKGTPSAAKCGFSSKMVALLQSHNVPFASFDILQDEAVRAGLKVLSDWPTYPQLYVKGELMGGLDIISEMAASGSLLEQFGVSAAPAPVIGDMNARLKSLINRAPVMLFMKGQPSQPRCGFSRSIVSLLQEEGIEFDSFDILTDEDVRQALKEYSDWPTYPQLYVRGELIGGLDIVKDMKEQGSIKEQLGL